ncbi:MAG TPA: TonB-dependent receptor [Gemmatimonadales bacterium]|nr:TonB-dependent receptor [Gemmatimonadales bacterium]
MQVIARAQRARSNLAALLLLLLPPVLAAQTRDSTRLEDLVVTATRLPTPLHAIGSSTDLFLPGELRRRQISSLRDALQLAPGGVILANGGPGAVSSLFLRGVSSSQTLFLVDGIRVNDANTSAGSFLGGADLTGLARLEIVRGPQSTLYGGAAIGGVVSLDAAPGTGPAHGGAELEGGSFESWRGRAWAAGGSGRIGLAVALTANGTENQRRPNDWDQRTQLIRVDYRVSSRIEAGATFRGLQHSYTSPGDLRTSNTTPEGTTTFENHLATVWLEATPLPRWRSRLTAGAQEQFTKGTGRFNGSAEFSFVLDNSRRVLDWQNTVLAGPRATLVAGLNREWSTATSDGAALDERLLGAYAEALLAPISEVALTAGLRSDNYNTFDDAVTWRVTGAWRPRGATTRLRASYGTGFMPPSLAARFGSVFQEPNPDIRPERSRGWDAGVDQEIAGGRATLGLTWFHNSLTDLIGFEGATFPALGRNINIDRARTRGIEASARVRTGALDARLAWTRLSAVSLSAPDPAAQLIRRPRHTLNGDAGLTLGSRATIGAGLLVVADRVDEDFNSFPSERIDPGDYAIARVYGAVGLGRGLTLRARIENLFDERYEPVYGFPGLGRSLLVSAMMEF